MVSNLHELDEYILFNSRRGPFSMIFNGEPHYDMSKENGNEAKNNELGVESHFKGISLDQYYGHGMGMTQSSIQILHLVQNRKTFAEAEMGTNPFI